MEKDYMIVFQYLILGAKLGKQVEIFYHHMYPEKRRAEGKPAARYGSIQPVRWVKGRFGKLQVLAWDVEKGGWRRFAVENIERVQLTDIDWARAIEHEIEQMP